MDTEILNNFIIIQMTKVTSGGRGLNSVSFTSIPCEAFSVRKEEWS